MSRTRRHAPQSAGLPPGTPVHVGPRRTDTVRVTVIDYDSQEIRETQVTDLDEIVPFRDTPTVTWINVDGLQDVAFLASLASAFNLHPLMLEDILNTLQRPKMEQTGNGALFVVKMLEYGEQGLVSPPEQVSILLGPNFVISFQERQGDVFDSVRQRLRNGNGRVRQMGADYLAYSLLDAIVDQYYVILEKVDSEAEVLEERVLTNPVPETLSRLRKLRREVLVVRKSLWPLREIVAATERSEGVFSKDLDPYLRDLYDHTIQVMEIIEGLRDGMSGMFDVYMSGVSNRMNDVMKVLTIIATLFIPITFVAGVYGMNFKFMPELGSRWGYPAVLLVMAAAVVAMLFYFRRRKWL